MDSSKLLRDFRVFLPTAVFPGENEPLDVVMGGDRPVNTKRSPNTLKARRPLFERLKLGLEQGIAHVEGKLELKTTTISEIQDARIRKGKRK